MPDKRSLKRREADHARRSLPPTEREQRAEAGFADRISALAEKATRQQRANQHEAERLRKLGDTLAAEGRSLEDEKAALAERERAVLRAEQSRDREFAEARMACESELGNKRAEVDRELSAIRQRRLSELEEEITTLRGARLREVSDAENAERDRIREEIARERAMWAKQVEDASRQMQEARLEIESKRGKVIAQEGEIERVRSELEEASRHQERKGQRLEQQWQKRIDELDVEVEARVDARRRSLELEKDSLREEIDRLRERVLTQDQMEACWVQFRLHFGDAHPADIIRDVNSKSNEIKRLREDLATRPTAELRERYEELEAEARHQRVRADGLSSQLAAQESAIAEVGDLRRRSSELEADNKSEKQRARRFEDAANEAQSELNRLRAAYTRPADVQARYKEIELPHIKAERVRRPDKESIDELAWLKRVQESCDKYGMHFNPRILKAFHTALKTAEWSPLTVLAGVSGTGKSELPRLYSHFGGLMFEPLSVQPNWDSQESMLGFFNSIDNKFDAQPVLRFLAQSQKGWSVGSGEDGGYPGLKECVCLVLLDEMNLAHPELYFAEFLSKLELRRGMKGSDVPSLPVKIGAGMPPYQLPLGRNVLWTGTMNQDETTKSLSDKVLDRSIIIHFPRPAALKRRVKLTALDEKNRGPVLHKDLWQSWLVRDSAFSDEDIKPYIEFIQQMNAALAVAGRAIGHRVWQSVEYYMANYPDVRATQTSDRHARESALHVAFEDQLVQKVMPKLRGIDTRGRSRTDCLDKILSLINAGIGGMPFDLAEDFNRACELGYGQFIWQSADYLGHASADAAGSDTRTVEDEETSDKPIAVVAVSPQEGMPAPKAPASGQRQGKRKR
jgi:hypothetical protein